MTDQESEIEFECDVFLEHISRGRQLHIYQYPTHLDSIPQRPYEVTYHPNLSQVQLETPRIIQNQNVDQQDEDAQSMFYQGSLMASPALTSYAVGKMINGKFTIVPVSEIYQLRPNMNRIVKPKEGEKVKTTPQEVGLPPKEPVNPCQFQFIQTPPNNSDFLMSHQNQVEFEVEGSAYHDMLMLQYKAIDKKQKDLWGKDPVLSLNQVLLRFGTIATDRLIELFASKEKQFTDVDYARAALESNRRLQKVNDLPILSDHMFCFFGASFVRDSRFLPNLHRVVRVFLISLLILVDRLAIQRQNKENGEIQVWNFKSGEYRRSLSGEFGGEFAAELGGFTYSLSLDVENIEQAEVQFEGFYLCKELLAAFVACAPNLLTDIADKLDCLKLNENRLWFGLKIKPEFCKSAEFHQQRRIVADAFPIAVKNVLKVRETFLKDRTHGLARMDIMNEDWQ